MNSLKPVTSVVQKGFTLIELVIVIIILSVLGIATSNYIVSGVDIYTDIAERDKSLNSVRFVMERLRREVSGALPNSAVVTAGGQCLTFTPIVASSIYAADFPINPISSATGTIATIPVADYRFAEGDKAVVYLLTAIDLDSTKVAKPLTSDTTNSRLTFNDDAGFSLGSPAKRLYIIRDSVSYYFTGTNDLFRAENCDGKEKHLMGENMKGRFSASEASLQRNSLVKVSFTLDFDGQEVPVEQTLHISNVP
ncbi:prepilin-type N-terminal cleavage/methylation domain-containing protein [Psychromonas ossibalaenae]|uniref:prepilin-type N-terminal cleavage/methylation domain-containing protein n=1 Tax=Psychromonas ossibalaenae TaxID=444922 RepID=UPI00035E4944|nr:prepilin-type N-terminal cleavage/methylation domain-containing protein [Psychromonas ossibalaenae]